MKEYNVRLRRTFDYSLTVEAEDPSDASDQAIELVEEHGETPINPRAEATVVSTNRA